MLSVILPNYNHAHLITRALNAIAGQDCPANEIIVVDDCSIDDSRAVVEQLSKSIPAISLIVNSENKGVAYSLQRGLEMARGDYLYFAASDDWILPGFFKLATDTLVKYPRAGLFCGETMLVDGVSGRSLGIRPAVRPRWTSGEIEARSVRRLLMHTDNFIVTTSSVFRRDATIDAGGFDASLGSFADGILVRRIALRQGFCFVPRPVAVWQIFAAGASRSTALKPEAAKRFLADVPQLLEMDPIFPRGYAKLFRRRWRFATARLSLEQTPIVEETLLSVGAPTGPDKWILKQMRRINLPLPIFRAIALAWLFLRTHPTSLTRLFVTRLFRAFASKAM